MRTSRHGKQGMHNLGIRRAWAIIAALALASVSITAAPAQAAGASITANCSTIGVTTSGITVTSSLTGTAGLNSAKSSMPTGAGNSSIAVAAIVDTITVPSSGSITVSQTGCVKYASSGSVATASSWSPWTLDSSTNYLGSSTPTPSTLTVSGTGVVVMWDSGNSNYVVLNFTSGSSSSSSCTPAKATAFTNAATSIGNTQATLHALVSPNGSPTTTWFKVASDTATLVAGGGETLTAVVDAGASNTLSSSTCGAAATPVHADLSGLTPRRAYYYAAYAQNSLGGHSVLGTILSGLTTSDAQAIAAFGPGINVFATTQMPSVGAVTVDTATATPSAVTISVPVAAGNHTTGVVAVASRTSSALPLWTTFAADNWFTVFSGLASSQMAAAKATSTTWGSTQLLGTSILDYWQSWYTTIDRGTYSQNQDVHVAPMEFVSGSDTHTMSVRIKGLFYPGAYAVHVVAVSMTDTVTAGSVILTHGGAAPTYFDLSSTASDTADGSFTINPTTVAVGDGPYALAASNGRVFVANYYASTVSVIDPATRAVMDTINVGDLPISALAYHGRVFIANTGTSSLSVIDAASLQVVSTIALPFGPDSLAVQNGVLWVAGNTDTEGSVVAVDPNTLQLTGQSIDLGRVLSVGGIVATNDALAVAFTPVSTATVIDFLDTAGETVTASVSVGTMSMNPLQLAFTGGNILVPAVGGPTPGIVVIDPRTKTVTKRITFGSLPMALTASSGTVFVADPSIGYLYGRFFGGKSSPAVYFLDAASGNLLATYPIASGGAAFGVLVVDGKLYYTDILLGTVTIVDVAGLAH